MARRNSALMVSLTLFTTLPLVLLFASPAPSIKRSKSDRDINAVGHREIIPAQYRKFIGPPEKEMERGAALAAEVERSAKLIHDPALTDYIKALAQNLARNSDAKMPITVTLIDSDEVNACTSPGGYQYVTLGLVLQLQSEGELAALLAHEIAHTALHSPTIQGIRQALMQLSASSPVQNSAFKWFTCTAPPFLEFSGMLRMNEFNADYFGIQYLYKAGYDIESYSRFIERIWASGASANGNDILPFLQFPRASDRIKALRAEIADILPQPPEATVSTSEFEEFKDHLHAWRTEHPEPNHPILRRTDTHN